MIHLCTISQMRDNLGKYARLAGMGESRFSILKNGREVAGLVSVADLNLLDNAGSRSMEYKALQIAEEMMRWRIIREGLAELSG